MLHKNIQKKRNRGDIELQIIPIKMTDSSGDEKADSGLSPVDYKGSSGSSGGGRGVGSIGRASSSSSSKGES